MDAMRYLIHIFNSLWSIDKYCILCKFNINQLNLKIDDYKINSCGICNDCINSIAIINYHDNRCHKCMSVLQSKNNQCQLCQENHMYFDQLFCGYEYCFPVDKILHKMKYQLDLSYSKVLSFLFLLFIKRCANHLNYIAPDIIIPVPLNKDRLRYRGFNQVLELLNMYNNLQQKCYNQQKVLLRTVEQELTLETHAIKETIILSEQYIVRTINTKYQAKLSQQSRLRNVYDAFYIEYNLDGLDIVIVDDIVTTRSTVNEIARVIRAKYSPKSITVWAFADANR